MKVIESVKLTNTQFGHSKSYESALLDDGSKFFIRNTWGKIGGAQQVQRKGPFDPATGTKEYKAAIAKKKGEGYVEEGSANKTDSGPDLETMIPMGAEEDEDGIDAKLEDPDYVAENKYDGSHYLLKFLGQKIGFKLHSRKLSVKDNRPVDKTGNVPHIIDEAEDELAGLVSHSFALDGEILCAEEGSNLVTSIMGSKPEKAIARQKENGYVRFMVFDIPWLNGKPLFDVPFRERRQILEQLFRNNGPFKHIFLAPQVKDKKREFLKKILAEGKEGIMLKRLDGLYQPGEKPKDTWIKVKAKKTDDFVIMGFIPGKGKYDGLVGAIVFGQYDRKGKLIEISQCSGFPDEERKKISKNPKGYIGKVVEVEFQQRTPASEDSPGGSLRHPRWKRWREDGDKIAKECVLK